MRFSIRDLLWATALIAMGFGWWNDRHTMSRELDRAQAWRLRAGGLQTALEHHGWTVTWNSEWPIFTVIEPEGAGHSARWSTWSADTHEPTGDELPEN